MNATNSSSDGLINKDLLQNAGYVLGEPYTPDHKEFTECGVFEESSGARIATITFRKDYASLQPLFNIRMDDPRYVKIRDNLDILGYALNQEKSEKWIESIGSDYIRYDRL